MYLFLYIFSQILMSVGGQIFVMSQKLVSIVMDHTGVNPTMIVSQGTRQIQGLVNVLVS
jgi:hypothetical protein